MNEETRPQAFRLALAIGGGNRELAPKLFRNHRAAVDLFLRWLVDQDIQREQNEEFDAALVAAAGTTLEDSENNDDASSNSQTSDHDNDDDEEQGPKTWDQVEDLDNDAFFDFAEKSAITLTAMDGRRGSTSNNDDDLESRATSEDDDESSAPDPLAARVVMATTGAKYTRGSSGPTTKKRALWDPLGLTLVQSAWSEAAAAAVATPVSGGIKRRHRKRGPRVADDPQELLETMYSESSRADLTRGLMHLERDLSSKDTAERKLVHDRLDDLVRVREAVDRLSQSNEIGLKLAHDALEALRIADYVSNQSLGPLLAREDRQNQARKALSIVMEQHEKKNLFSFPFHLDAMIQNEQWELATKSVADFVRGDSTWHKVEHHREESFALNKSVMSNSILSNSSFSKNVTAVKFDESYGDHDNGDSREPEILLRAKADVRASAERLVRALRLKIEQITSPPTQNILLALLHLKDCIPKTFSNVFSDKIKDDVYVTTPRELLVHLARIKAEETKQTIQQCCEKHARDLAERCSRAKTAVAELTACFKPSTSYAELDIESIPPNVMGRYKAARAALDRYTQTALLLCGEVFQCTMGFLKWCEPFKIVLGAGNDVDRACQSVSERCSDVLTSAVFDSAPPLIPGETVVVLNTAKDGDAFWSAPAPSILNTSQFSNSTRASPTVGGGISVSVTGGTDDMQDSSSVTSGGSRSINSNQYKSFQVVSGGVSFVSYGYPGAVEFIAECNCAGNTYPWFSAFAKKATESILDQALDELVAGLELFTKCLGSMNIEGLIASGVSSVSEFALMESGEALVGMSTDKSPFAIPVIDVAWYAIRSTLDGVVDPLLNSYENPNELRDSLGVLERVTKATRHLGTILGRLAEQYRLRVVDSHGQGFLILARECNLLKWCISKDLSPKCDVADVAAQLERLEPALATQYLKACCGTMLEKVDDALNGPKDPLTGLRCPLIVIERGDPEDNLISERWLGLLSYVADSVAECNTYLGSRYAAKLRFGMTRAMGSRVLSIVQTWVEVWNVNTRRVMELDLSFVYRALLQSSKETKDEFGFAKAMQLLRDKGGCYETEQRMRKIDAAIETWPNLVVAQSGAMAGVAGG